MPVIDQAGSSLEQPVPYTYVPPSHAKALDPDSSLIEGIRGSGKSFWWSALLSSAHRQFVAEAFPDTHLPQSVKIERGFGDNSGKLDTPSKDVISSLSSEFSPRTIWRSVVAEKAQFGGSYGQIANQSNVSWRKRAEWVHENPEDFDVFLGKLDDELVKKDQHLVIVFDALDRLADDWQSIRPLAKALLQVGLEMRSTRRVRFKMFVRPDMLEDRAIVGFPDASKLLARKTSLNWRRIDLYALLFQCLGNSPTGGAHFRKFVKDNFGFSYVSTGGNWLVPPELRADEDQQERVFISIAGKAMSSSPTGQKRGKPYSWLVNHLQDGRDQVSPRSFAAAVRHAAERTRDEYNNHRLPIHFSAIQAGVQAASQVRVDELVKEDYPWVDTVMRPLKGGVTIPCPAKDIIKHWKQAKVLNELEKEMKSSGVSVKLPPQHLDDGHEGVMEDLQDLGVMQRLSDGRVQMPDVYRIAFGLGRRGGVKPLK
ncbi:hypothetical protein NCPPB940_43780 [Xanthomonas hortorum pv. taraxaci]|nr:hypothetical protein NCPPB940_43780 [Xanthomonas hortorum pv. taraxaci]CAD0359487.1 hypothetical protein NCPPB940_43780 [Xanthomonas hortorum pv. taraxaci]